MLSLHKRISVDASDKRKIITLVEADSSKVLWDSTLNYLAYKSASDEVEFCAIIYAMKNYPNVNLEIISDCKSVVDILNNEGKVSQKIQTADMKILKKNELQQANPKLPK